MDTPPRRRPRYDDPDRVLHGILFFDGACTLSQQWGGVLPDEHIARLETILAEAAAAVDAESEVRPRLFDASLLFDHPRFTTLYCHCAQWWPISGDGSIVRTPRTLCLATPHGREFVAFFRRALGFVLRWIVDPTSVPLEHYLAQLAALEYPAHSSAVELNWGAAAVFRLTRPPLLALSAVDCCCFHALFHALSPHNVVRVLGALLSESKLLLVARDRSTMMQIRIALCALLYPFEWCFPALSSTRRDPVAVAGFRVPFPCIVSLTVFELDRVAEDAARIGTRHLHDLRAEIADEWFVVHIDEDCVVAPRAKEQGAELPLLSAARLERQLRQCVPPRSSSSRSRNSSGTNVDAREGEPREWDVAFGSGSVIPQTVQIEMEQPESSWFERARQRRRNRSRTLGSVPRAKTPARSHTRAARGYVFLEKELRRDGVAFVSSFAPTAAACWAGSLQRPGAARLVAELKRARVADAVQVVAVNGRPIRTVNDCVALLYDGAEWTSVASVAPVAPSVAPSVAPMALGGEGSDEGDPPPVPLRAARRTRAASVPAEAKARITNAELPPPVPPRALAGARAGRPRAKSDGCATSAEHVGPITLRFACAAPRRGRRSRRVQLHAHLAPLLRAERGGATQAKATQAKFESRASAVPPCEQWYTQQVRSELSAYDAEAREHWKPPVPPRSAAQLEYAAATSKLASKHAAWIDSARAACLECIATLLHSFKRGTAGWQQQSSTGDTRSSSGEGNRERHASALNSPRYGARKSEAQESAALELFDSNAMLATTPREFRPFVARLLETQALQHFVEEQYNNCPALWGVPPRSRSRSRSRSDSGGGIGGGAGPGGAARMAADPSPEAIVAGQIFAAALAYRGTHATGFAPELTMRSPHAVALDALHTARHAPARVVHEPCIVGLLRSGEGEARGDAAAQPTEPRPWSLEPALVEARFAARNAASPIPTPRAAQTPHSSERGVRVKKRLSVMLSAVLGAQAWRRRALGAALAAVGEDEHEGHIETVLSEDADEDEDGAEAETAAAVTGDETDAR